MILRHFSKACCDAMTTLRDHIAATIQEALPIIAELAAQERCLKDAEKIVDKQQRERAQNGAKAKADEKRGKLLVTFDEPAAIYQYLDVTKQAGSTGFRSKWQRRETLIDDCLRGWPSEMKEFYERHFRKPDIASLDLLPPFSFMLQFTFQLEQPLLSRDDQDFYIIDNPVRKDKVFRLPYIPPSSWKGSLRAALWQNRYKEDSDSVRRLFGNPKRSNAEEPAADHAGRLQFFPVFFEKKSLEIINPHDRVRKTGTIPIPIESVPIGTDGCFSLLYVPFDCVGNDHNTIRREAAQDLRVLAIGLRAMFRMYGIGAKTSSGFGTAREKLKHGFAFTINCRDSIPPVPQIDQTQAKGRPEMMVRGLAELGTAMAQGAEETEKGIGFKDLDNYLTQVADSLTEVEKLPTTEDAEDVG